jgi:TPP-dependent trihydroxycyclohexane-1,2-dione (THcHDO) dehydratase
VIIDEDGYVELRYWNDSAATPAQIAATITRALSVITTPAVTAPG